jgi:hypothetical protein
MWQHITLKGWLLPYKELQYQLAIPKGFTMSLAFTGKCLMSWSEAFMMGDKAPPDTYISLEEKLAIFLYTCVTGLSLHHVGEHFQHTSETISKYVIFSTH